MSQSCGLYQEKLVSAYSFCTDSKWKMGTCLGAEALVTIFGILALTKIIPGLGIAKVATFTGGSLFLFSSVLAYRNWQKKEKGTQQERPKFPNLDPNLSWKDKLEKIREYNQAAFSTPTVPPQECLKTLCQIAWKSTAHLFKHFPQCDITNDQMQALVKSCEGKSENQIYSLFVNTLFEHLASLNAFLQSQTQAVLDNPHPTEEQQQNFKALNKQMRMILLFLLSHEDQKNYYLNKYTAFVSNAYGNYDFTYSDDANHPVRYFDNLSVNPQIDEIKLKSFYEFLSQFFEYRRSALLRLFPDKIKTLDEQGISSEVRTLLHVTWFHGTRALTTLFDTEFTMIPTLWLHHIGLISFFGEMQNGCQQHGVNADSLSGTYLDHVDWAMDTYATGFEFRIETEMQEAEKFLSISIDIKSEYYFSRFCEIAEYLPRMEVALKRWIRWDPASFGQKKEQYLSKLKHLKDVVAKIEQSRPRQIFRPGKDTYFSSKYSSILHNLRQIEVCLNTPPAALTETQKGYIQNNFPAVLGSLTLHSRPSTPNQGTGERLVFGTAQIGKDLQLLCVESANLDKAKKWAEQYPDLKLQIFSFEQIRAAQIVNKKISPYLADILSQKKVDKLLGKA